MGWIAVMEFVKRYKVPILVILGVLLFPAIFAKILQTVLSPFARLADTVKDTGNSAAVDAQIKSNPGTYVLADGRPVSLSELDADAKAIFSALGLDKSWWNPGNWTENEAAVVGICLKHSKPSFTLLATRYQAINNRPLSSDLTEYLSTDDLNKITHLYI